MKFFCHTWGCPLYGRGKDLVDLTRKGTCSNCDGIVLPKPPEDHPMGAAQVDDASSTDE